MRYNISPQWALFLEKREKSLSNTNNASKAYYGQHSKNLPQLNVGDKVRCQNARTKKWDREGTIMTVKGYQYEVKLLGSRRMEENSWKHSIPVSQDTVTEAATSRTLALDRATQHQPSSTSPQISPPRAQTPPIMQTEGDCQIPSTQHFVRRSSRTTNRPKWFHKEFNVNVIEK